MLWWKKFRYVVPPSPYDSSNVESRKIGTIFFLNPIYWALRTCQPNFVCSAVYYGSNNCICNSNFWPNGVIPTLRGRKVWKSKVNNVVKMRGTSRSFWNLRSFYPSKWVWPWWVKNLNYKYKYLTNSTQLSSKFTIFRYSTFNDS